MKKNNPVIVEIYNEDGVITRKEVNDFKENIKPAFTTNPDVNLNVIDLEESNQSEIFEKAISDSQKKSDTVYLVQPDYSFSMGRETYYLWLFEDEGSIANSKDSYAIYSLSDNLLKEIIEIVEN